MSTASDIPVAALREPGRSPLRASLPWIAAAALAAAAGTLGLAPLVLIGGIMAFATALALGGEALLFLALLVTVSGLGFNWGEGSVVGLGGHTINLGGVRWGLIVLGCGALLFRHGLPAIPRPLRPYAGFVLVAAAAVLWAPNRFEGIKNLLQFVAPLLIALVAYRCVRVRRQVAQLTSLYWVSLVIGVVAMFAVVVGTPLLGEELPFGHGLAHRGFAMWLLPCYALALAAWRVRGSVHLWAVAGLFLLGVITLSRTTVGAMLLLGLVAMLVKPARLRPVPLLLLVLAGAAALQYGPLRERFFADPRVGFGKELVSITGSGEQMQLTILGLNTSGRGLVWVRTFLHGAERPVLGHGTGSASDFLDRELAGVLVHPHNDYIRVFHDQGLVGLGLVLAFGAATLLALRRLWRSDASPGARELALAALLAMVGYLAVAFFDNSMLYVTNFTQNIFLLLALALRAAELELEPAPDGVAA